MGLHTDHTVLFTKVISMFFAFKNERNPMRFKIVLDAVLYIMHLFVK